MNDYHRFRYSHWGRTLAQIRNGRWLIARRESQFYANIISRMPYHKKLAYDIGAGDGSITRIFADIGLQVVSIDPDVRNFQLLRSQFGKNENVTLINKAVGSGCDDLIFYDHLDGHTLGTTQSKWKEANMNKYHFGSPQTVRQIDLKTLLKTHGLPDLLKVDAEGSEKEILCNLNYPVDNIVFEVNLPLYREDAIIIMDHLTRLDSKYSFKPYMNYKRMSGDTLDRRNIEDILSTEDNMSLDIWASVAY